MNILQRVGKIWDWLKSGFETLETSGVQIAVTITQNINIGVKSNLVGFLSTAFDELFHTKIAENAITVLKLEIPKLLAAELAVQGLGVNPTEADFLAFENRILAAFNISIEKSKHYTVIAAQIYGILHQLANQGAQITFAEKVEAVEEAFQIMMEDISEEKAAAG